jgi:phosphate transport system permease protein
MVRALFFLIAAVCASAVIFIVFFIFLKGIAPFTTTYTINGVGYKVDFWSFITGSVYKTGEAGYGAGYIVVNTMFIALLTTLLAAPISIMTALVIVRMSNKYVGHTLNTVIELLAAIPSVIYGMFGLGIITGWTKSISESWPWNYQSAGGLSTLTVVLVLTMMSIPTITMLSITAIKAVSKDIIHGSLALGASVVQTNYRVVLTSAKSGIFAGIILGVDRSLGEATAVTMVAGNASTGPSFNLFSTTRTLTSTMLTGMSDASGLNYDIRFSIAILLIFLIIITNIILVSINRRLGRTK